MKFVGLVAAASGEQVPLIIDDGGHKGSAAKELHYYDAELSEERGVEGFKEFELIPYDAYDDDELNAFNDEIYLASDIYGEEATLIIAVKYEDKRRVLVIDSMESMIGKVCEMVTGEVVEEVSLDFVDYGFDDEEDEVSEYVEAWELMYDRLIRSGR